jgi:CHAD domain-containing protein
MSFSVKPGRSIRRELKRLARKELGGAAVRLLQDHRSEEDVHEARKSVKKVEAVSQLLDQIGFAPPRKDVKRLRAARRALSNVRDAVVIVETIDRLQSRFADRLPEHTWAMIRRQLTRRKASISRRARAGAGNLTRAGTLLRKSRRSIKQWSAPVVDVSELPDVLKRSYRASRKAMNRADARKQASDFHDWRKRVKTLLYQLRLAQRLVSRSSIQIAEFTELETALGEEHNLAVLRTRLQRDRTLRHVRSHVESLTAITLALQGELRRTALVLGARLYRQAPKDFGKDLRRRLRPRGAPRRKPSPQRGQAVG